jgi:hypothetical protein
MSRDSVRGACGLVIKHHCFLLWRAFFISFLSVFVSRHLRIFLIPLLIVLLPMTANFVRMLIGPLCDSSTGRTAFLERIILNLYVFNCHACVGHLYINTEVPQKTPLLACVNPLDTWAHFLACRDQMDV